MDEAFWSNVVKRWADASESVIKLKQELAVLQRERANDTRHDALHDRYSQHLEADSWVNKEVITSVPESSSTTRDELNDAEVGLVRAKEEYRRLQSELAHSSQRVQALSREKEELCSRHEEEATKLKNIIQTLRSLPAPRALPSDLSHGVDALETSGTAPLARAPATEDLRIFELERKIELLTSSLKGKDAENRELQDELTLTKDKLLKSEENQRLLLKSMSKLQAITRSSLDHNLLHSDVSRKPSRLSMSSDGQNLRLVESKKELRTSRQPLGPTFDSPYDIKDTKDVDQLKHPPPSMSGFSARLDVITNLPAVACPSLDPSQNMFDREFLKSALGDGVRTLLTHFKHPHDVDMKSLTSSYLCPTLNHHPWCPTIPGQHGFIFVGFGKDRDAYNTPVVRHLFVGLAKKQTHKRFFRYLGRYRVSRENGLTVDEWKGLSSEPQKMLVKLFKDKENDPRDVDDILGAFNIGKLSIPCVQLQFVGFDNSLYDALSSMKKEEWTQ